MLVNIKGNVTEALRSHVLDRLQAALDQFDSSVRKVSIQLLDLNGPRGGENQAARVRVQLASAAPVVIEHRGTDMYAVVSHAADRVKNSVGRILERRSERRHGH